MTPAEAADAADQHRRYLGDATPTRGERALFVLADAYRAMAATPPQEGEEIGCEDRCDGCQCHATAFPPCDHCREHVRAAPQAEGEAASGDDVATVRAALVASFNNGAHQRESDEDADARALLATLRAATPAAAAMPDDPLFAAPDRPSRTSRLTGPSERVHRAVSDAVGGAEFFEGTTTEARITRRVMIALHEVLAADPLPPDVVIGADAAKLPPGSVFVARGDKFPVLVVLGDGNVYMAGSSVIAHPARDAEFVVYHRAPTPLVTPGAQTVLVAGDVVDTATDLHRRAEVGTEINDDEHRGAFLVEPGRWWVVGVGIGDADSLAYPVTIVRPGGDGDG